MVRYYHPPNIQSVNLCDRIIFELEDEYVELEGESVQVVKEVLPKLREGCDIAALVDQTDYTEEVIEELVGILLQHNLLVELEGDDAISDEVSPDRYHMEARTETEFAEDAVDRLQNEITVTAPPGLANKIEMRLNFQTVNPDDVVTEDLDSILVNVCYGNSPKLNHQLNDQAIEQNFDFLPIRIFRSKFIMGPLFLPGESVGYETAYKRERSNDMNPDRKLRFDEEFEGNRSFPLTHEMGTLISGALETELKKYLLEYDKPNTVDSTITIDLETLGSEQQSVLRLPNGEQLR
jgi:hypothetical protein